MLSAGIAKESQKYMFNNKVLYIYTLSHFTLNVERERERVCVCVFMCVLVLIKKTPNTAADVY